MNSCLNLNKSEYLKEEVKESWTPELRFIFASPPSSQEIDRVLKAGQTQYERCDAVELVYFHFDPLFLDYTDPSDKLSTLLYIGSEFDQFGSRPFDQEMGAVAYEILSNPIDVGPIRGREGYVKEVWDCGKKMVVVTVQLKKHHCKFVEHSTIKAIGNFLKQI